MFEKKLYTLSALLSLSCSAYAMDGEIREDEFVSSPSMSIAGPSSSTTPDQESDQSDEEVVSVPSPTTSAQSSLSPHEEVVSVSTPATSAQNSLFPNDKEKVTFKWSELKAAARNIEEDQRARNLIRFLDALREKYYYTSKERPYGDPTGTYELPLLQEELSYNPTQRFRNGGLVNPLLDKYGVYSEVAMKIATIMGTHPTTKDAIAQLSKLVGRGPFTAGNHKVREMYLRRFVSDVDYIIEAERKVAAQEKEALVCELERLRAENEVLKAQAASSRD